MDPITGVFLCEKPANFGDMDPVVALGDFKKRVANYEKAYEPIGDEEEGEDIQYCKVGPLFLTYNAR